MTIYAFTKPTGTGADARRTGGRGYSPTRHQPSDRWIGLGLGIIILALCCASAFTGGLSVSTGGVEMNLTGSLSQGMQIHFASVNG